MMFHDFLLLYNSCLKFVIYKIYFFFDYIYYLKIIKEIILRYLSHNTKYIAINIFKEKLIFFNSTDYTLYVDTYKVKYVLNIYG